MAEEHAEGRYTDPFGRHEARSMSDGTPTKLMRDGGVEAYDEPPDEEPSVTPTDAGQFGATWGARIPVPGPHDDE